MSDGDEVSDGFTMAIEASRELRKKNPRHELLQFLDDGCSDEVWEKFQTRFGKQGISRSERATSPAQAYFWTQYSLALREACSEAQNSME